MKNAFTFQQFYIVYKKHLFSMRTADYKLIMETFQGSCFNLWHCFNQIQEQLMKFSFVHLRIPLAVSILWCLTIYCLTGISYAKEVVYSCLDTKELEVHIVLRLWLGNRLDMGLSAFESLTSLLYLWFVRKDYL